MNEFIGSMDITAKGCNLYYGDFHALKNINIEIPEKQVTALIGPSGCGKSTFLKTLNRMNDLIPTVKITGEVCYNGRNIFDKEVDVNELRRDVGMVFQKPNPLMRWPLIIKMKKNNRKGSQIRKCLSFTWLFLTLCAI